MIKWNLSQGCKDRSIFEIQSRWYTILTNWRITHMIISIDALKKLHKVGIEGTYIPHHIDAFDCEQLMHLNCGVGEDSWESRGLQGDPTSPFKGDQSWVFFGRTDAKAETAVLWPPHAELTHWKRLWCLERLGAGGEGDDRGWGGWMASRTRWTWVWVNSGSWW